MRKKLLMGCLPLLLIVGLGTWWGARALRSAPPAPARYEVADRGEVAIKVTETGTIEPLKKVEVKSKVAGRIERLLVQEGSRVKSGQLLAEIDPTEINSQVAQIQAQLDGARARLRQAQRGVGYQEEQTTEGIEQARAAVRSAEERLRVARIEAVAQPERTRSDLDQAESTLRSARDSLTLLETATQPQARVQAQTGYDEARAAADTARRNLERSEKLFDKGFVSAQALDGLRADLAGATARSEQAKKRLDLIEKQNALERAETQNRIAQAEAALKRTRADRSQQTRKQEVTAAQAALTQVRSQLRVARAGETQNQIRGDDVAQARASVSQLENQMNEVAVRQGDTRLVAPMSGVVTQRYIEEGELVTSGVSAFSAGQPVMQIANLSQMRVTMSVNEVDVQRLRTGLPVEIVVDGVRDGRFTGRVHKVAPAAVGAANAAGAAAAGTPGRGVIRFAVEVLVNGDDERLRPGMSARCTIRIAERKNVVRVPKTCVTGEGDKAVVQVLAGTDKNGAATFAPRHVVTGLSGDTFVEIVSGLKAGEKVQPGAYAGPPRKGVMGDQ